VGFPSFELGPEEAMAWCEGVFTALGATSTGLEAPSRTTRRAIAYVEGALDTVPSLADAAARASVSPTRLTHRFSEEVGIPFRRFVLWARLKRAVEETRRGASLTEAAVEAGFSDAAHLSRTFRAMFGLSPSMVLPLMEFFGGPWGSPGAPSR
jgi:AraC-like DNA-binding protein